MADIDLQKAVDMTIARMLDGAGLQGIPGYRDIVINVADDRESAQLVCPAHGVVLADLDTNLVITAEHECTECEILACNDCSTYHQHLCQKHYEQVSA